MGTKEKTRSEKTPRDRRSFLMLIWAALAAVGLVEGLGIVIAFLRSGKAVAAGAGQDARRMPVGSVDEFKPASVTPFPRGKFYLVRLADGGFLALSRQCTHLGCTVPWDADQQKFICPCHASAFDLRGAVLKSPANRALDQYPLEIEIRTVRQTVLCRNPLYTHCRGHKRLPDQRTRRCGLRRCG